MDIRHDCNKCGCEDLGGYLAEEDGEAVIRVDVCEDCLDRNGAKEVVRLRDAVARKVDQKDKLIQERDALKRKVLELERALDHRRKACFEARTEVERLQYRVNELEGIDDE